MLDDRKATILRAVVEDYIETAQPVGSARISRAPGVDVSSATIRNDMAQLERDGYLVQPHTSAGRIPTDKGYRFFVDHLAPDGRLGPGQRERIQDFFNRTHGALERMLHETSCLLSNLTDYAGVVVGPPHEAALVRGLQLVGLSPGVVLLVAVLSNGVVEKRVIEVAGEVAEEQVCDASRHLAAHLVGSSQARQPGPPPTADPSTDRLVDQALAALSGTHDDEADYVFVGGASRMAAAFDAVETVRQVLAILEQQYVVVSLLKGVLDRGLSVAIGAEVGLASLAGCSVVVAPYEVEGERSGTVGVVGPTRMNYGQALAAVALVSRRLGRHLSDG